MPDMHAFSAGCDLCFCHAISSLTLRATYHNIEQKSSVSGGKRFAPVKARSRSLRSLVLLVLPQHLHHAGEGKPLGDGLACRTSIQTDGTGCPMTGM